MAIRQQLEDQTNLTARLESELRQLRAKYGQDSIRGEQQRDKDATTKANSQKEGEGDDKDDLSKVKADLERTRVDISKMGRRVGFGDVIGLETAKRVMQE